MRLIARVDTLWRIAREKIAVKGKVRSLLKFRHTNFLGRPGIDSRLVDYDIASSEHRSHEPACGEERTQVGALCLIDRRWHRDDVEIRVSKTLHLGRVGEARGARKFLLVHLVGAIDAAREFGDAFAIDIEAKHRKVPREIDGERQADIAETDNAIRISASLGRAIAAGRFICAWICYRLLRTKSRSRAAVRRPER